MDIDNEWDDDFESYSQINKKKESKLDLEQSLLFEFEDAIAANNSKLVFYKLDALFAHNILNEEIFLNYHYNYDTDEAYQLEKFFIRAFLSCLFKDNHKSLNALYEYTKDKAIHFFSGMELEFVGAGAAQCLILTNDVCPEILNLENHTSKDSLLSQLFSIRSLSHDIKIETTQAILDVYATIPYKVRDILDTYIYTHETKEDGTFLLGMHNYNNVIHLALLQDGTKYNDLLTLITHNCNIHNIKYDLNDNFYTQSLVDKKNIETVEFFITKGYDIKKYQYSFLSSLDFEWIDTLYKKNVLENTEENKNTIMNLFGRKIENLNLNSLQYQTTLKSMNKFIEAKYINLHHNDYNGNISHHYVKLIVNYLTTCLKNNVDYNKYNEHVVPSKMIQNIQPLIEHLEVLKKENLDFNETDMNDKKSIDYLKEFVSSLENYPEHAIKELKIPLEKFLFSFMLTGNKSSQRMKI